jgi:hypothetical protein
MNLDAPFPASGPAGVGLQPTRLALVLPSRQNSITMGT